MRTYIQEHQTEFLPEGVEAAVIPGIDEPPTTAGGVAPDEKHPTPEELKQRERERNARGLQWAWDTFDGAYQVAIRSTKGALELIKDAWDQSTSTTILWFLIVILVLSNLWTLMRMGSNKADAARKLEARKTEEREKWVQSIVTALWEELAASKDGSPVILQPPHHDVLSGGYFINDFRSCVVNSTARLDNAERRTLEGRNQAASPDIARIGGKGIGHEGQFGRL
jgi:hypothetical protein